MSYMYGYDNLMKDDSLEHHGIKGQKWGVMHGPPYPLSTTKHNSVIKKSKKERPSGSSEDSVGYRFNRPGESGWKGLKRAVSYKVKERQLKGLNKDLENLKEEKKSILNSYNEDIHNLKTDTKIQKKYKRLGIDTSREIKDIMDEAKEMRKLYEQDIEDKRREIEKKKQEMRSLEVGKK